MSSEKEDIADSDYERVLSCLESLPDRKVSAGRVEKEFDEPDFDVHRAIQDLVLLGEVELSQVRGTGGRVWLKRRSTPDDPESLEATSSVWRSYVAKDYRDRIADRLFTAREAAVRHLEESAAADVERLEPVPYLEDVWHAPGAAAQGGYATLDAVVRRETIYEDPRTTEGR